MFVLELQLDDTIVKSIEIAPYKELKEARELILRIRRRDLYQVLECCQYYIICSFNFFNYCNDNNACL